MTTGSAPLPFNDGKAQDAMRTIGEVAAGFGIKQHILRYWEQQFPMLRPLKRSGGRRLYRPEDVALVDQINRLINQQGYTLKGARQVVEGKAEASQADVATAAQQPQVGAGVATHAQNTDMVVTLKSIRNRLETALSAA